MITKLDLVNKLLVIAKRNGYEGPDYLYRKGFLIDQDNILLLLIRDDFQNATWGSEGRLRIGETDDVWGYIEEYVLENI